MGTKMKDDPELEKLFEGMSRETARKVANQGSPKKKMEKELEWTCYEDAKKRIEAKKAKKK